MMPRDGDMTSVVHRVARQALLTFKARAQEEAKAFTESHGELRRVMAEVRAADLRLAPRLAPPPPGRPPVTYMHICETQRFSMGVFLLRGGASIPLHDHPGMHGLLRVLYGTARISCFDRLERPRPPAQLGALRRAVLRSVGEYTEESGTCVLFPDRDNLHQIDAVDGPTAFMDVLAPPYEPDQGRDCHYYRLVTAPGPGGQEVTLREIPQPPEFWCGSEPYPGPQVCIGTL
ncbi:2-aminoethanethiol (cysteamine) dioxygenase b [Neosynchiropus ocellatus]